ncbi:MAG: hypothetical protein ACO20F_08665 [Robiginitalea sp.]|jgi:hypothetical protein
MNLKPLRDRGDLNPGKRTQEKIQNFRELLLALEDRGLTQAVVQALNLKIRALNEMQGPEKEYRKALVNTEYKILKFLEKEHKIVPKNHYQKTWLALGMTVFGVPIGVAMGTALGNMGFIGVGIGMGLAIGIAIGTDMDKKARKEGRQLEFEARI